MVYINSACDHLYRAERRVAVLGGKSSRASASVLVICFIIMIRSTLARVLQWLGIALPTFWSLHSELCHWEKKKKKKYCAQMDFCARCLGSCLRAFLLVRSISLTEHLTGAACRHPSWGQFYLANENPIKLTLVRSNHHRHGDLRTVQTSTLIIWTIERPLFETWWEEVTSGSQIGNPNVSVSFKDEVNTGGTVFVSVESEDGLRF